MLFLSLSLFAVICRESSLEPLKPNSLNSPARAENGRSGNPKDFAGVRLLDQ
jgi:hypothetical protein